MLISLIYRHINMREQKETQTHKWKCLSLLEMIVIGYRYFPFLLFQKHNPGFFQVVSFQHICFTCMWFVPWDVFRCSSTRQTTLMSPVCVFPDCPRAQKVRDYCRENLWDNCLFPLFCFSFSAFSPRLSCCIHSAGNMSDVLLSSVQLWLSIYCCSAIKCCLDRRLLRPRLWKQWKAMCFYCFSPVFSDVTTFWRDKACLRNIQFMNKCFDFYSFCAFILVILHVYCYISCGYCPTTLLQC